MLQFWRDHSLSITCTALGIVITGASPLLPEGKGFDIISGIGNAFLTAGIIFGLQGPLTEKNKPEEPAK